MVRHDPLANPELLIRRVYSFVAYRIGDGPDAEDVTSATFEGALRYRSTFDPRRGEPVSWLLAIARHEIGRYFAQCRLHSVNGVESAPWQDLTDDTDARLDLAVALRVLDDAERELIALRYGADLTARRIGEVLGRRTNAVEVALHRALSKLRNELEAPSLPEAVRVPEVTVAP
jgi:RNA polymerase sigma-70 factor (ECF subfamily)